MYVAYPLGVDTSHVLNRTSNALASKTADLNFAHAGRAQAGDLAVPARPKQLGDPDVPRTLPRPT